MLTTESTPLFGILLAILAYFITLSLYPHVLRFARTHGVVDNPDARKLQREPVPVLGGLVVFAGFGVAMAVRRLYDRPVLPRLTVKIRQWLRKLFKQT